MRNERNLLQRLKNLTSHINISGKQTTSIEAQYPLSPNLSVEDWEKDFKNIDPIKKALFIVITTQALGRTPDERTQYIEESARTGLKLIIGFNAKKQAEREQQLKQLVINVNSMSQENLENFAAALGIK